MGKANRQRRRLKEKARKRPNPSAQQGPTGPRGAPPSWTSAPQRTSSTQGAWWTPEEQPTLEERVALEISEARQALFHEDTRAFEAAVARVTERSAPLGWRNAVERTLTQCLELALTAAWRGGWQPADVVRLAGRKLTSQHVRLVCDAIAADLRRYATATIDPQWAPQLAELEINVWWRPDQTYLRAWTDNRNVPWTSVVPGALAVLNLLDQLPRLERLGPPPGKAPPTSAARRPGPAVDDRILARVRALLAKAESTTFPAEAETFTAGAQALMARHSIDLALLAATSQGPSDEPTGRRIGIDNPYEGPKAMLLGAVARANRCRTVWSRDLGFSTIVGFASDLDAVEMLFTSLLLQATAAMTQAGSRTDAYGRSRTRSFRQSFLTAYASRIGERLAEATGAQTAKVAAEDAGKNLLPVLASRDHAVEEAVSTLFPRTTPHTMSPVTNREGWISGLTAADLASLHAGQELPG